MSIHQNINLKTLNTFGIDANARYFASIQTLPELHSLWKEDLFHRLPKLILGEGSNVLFTQNFEGLLIKNAVRGIEKLSEDNDHIWIRVGGGEIWHDFVIYCIQQGYGGIENLSLIPGTVGAAPIQNIGAYGAELKDTFFELAAFHLQKGTVHTFNNESCEFGYRDSVFKNKLKDQYMILSVVLRLHKKPVYRLDYGQLKETLQQMKIKEPTLKSISDAVIHIRQSKLPNPKQLGNAGSFFKNPVIEEAHFEKLKKSFPHLPHFSVAHSDTKKIPAAWLIEQCGWKGKRFGEIGVYEKQALILVNYGAGTGSEIKELAEKIQQSVREMFDIVLVPEVNFI